ncbi:MAG: endonuclease/exonuclease/phosphatase family protein [bacterium]
MSEYHVAFWNVENLFDVEGSPRRSEKLDRTLAGELKGWTNAVLDSKIQQLASIIRQMNAGKGPDLLGVCEIENEYVLNLLVDALKALNRKYKIAHADTKDNRGIDVAFIYDSVCLTAKEQFSHFIVKRTASRDLLQVNFQTNSGNRLVVVGNHWPSRSGGQYESEPFRIIAGETLAYFHERIREVSGDENVAVLAMGDFNDEPFNRSLVEYAQSEQTRAKVTRAQMAKFLNLMWPSLGQGIGTHYFNNQASVLDQFLVSKGLSTGNSGITVLPESVEVLQFPEMKDGGTYQSPIRFGRPSEKSFNSKGFSDHYPISLRLQEA